MLQSMSLLLQEDPDVGRELLAFFPAHATRALTAQPNGAAAPKVLGTLNGGPPVSQSAAATAMTAPNTKPRPPANGEALDEHKSASSPSPPPHERASLEPPFAVQPALERPVEAA